MQRRFSAMDMVTQLGQVAPNTICALYEARQQVSSALALARTRCTRWSPRSRTTRPSCPWCERAEILEQRPDGVTARLHLSYLGVRQAFTTRNRQVPGSKRRARTGRRPFFGTSRHLALRPRAGRRGAGRQGVQGRVRAALWFCEPGARPAREPRCSTGSPTPSSSRSSSVPNRSMVADDSDAGGGATALEVSVAYSPRAGVVDESDRRPAARLDRRRCPASERLCRALPRPGAAVASRSASGESSAIGATRWPTATGWSCIDRCSSTRRKRVVSGHRAQGKTGADPRS